MTYDGGDTALHKAVRSRCVDTVRLLVEQDPDLEFPANNAGETPLYLATESGLVNCLSEILEHCTDQQQTAVHVVERLCMRQ
ncbi:hypothetical protein BC332_14122 [Capsicum chinense]|nr:hypothetical protein BC332_14122 [Capsicum chinense]